MRSAAEHRGGTAVAHAPKRSNTRELATLSLAALGVVYGDIGTSPLYAMKACFTKPYGVEVTPDNVVGIISMFFWSLTLVIGLKYLAFVMRADNQGEGGILALVALLKPTKGEAQTLKLGAYVLLGLFGASLLYGEAVITPVVSVLGAVEGLGVGNEELFTKPVIVGITIGILVGLFMFQKRGTASVGAVFGPAMLVWFLTIGIIGSYWIAQRPAILVAVDPRNAVRFFVQHGTHAFLILGAVVLCITGGEALYADMGHFGKKPIRAAWFFAAFPALLLSYFGQGAFLLRAFDHGDVAIAAVVGNPFFAMVDGWARYPLIAIATFAAIVASQALISGAFSLTQSAVQLGYCPRVTIRHTSGTARGQIYVPEVNTALMLGCIALVLGFGESTKLAAAYGIAVTGTMSITSVLFYGVMRKWGWSRLTAGALALSFLALDLSFFGANVHKMGEGSWLPLGVGVAIFTFMTTWHSGRARLHETIKATTLPMNFFLDVGQTNPNRVRGTLRIAGTAIFLTSSPEGAPPALLHYMKHNKALHEMVVLLSLRTKPIPEVLPSERIERVTDLGHGVYQVVATYGFMQTPNVLDVLHACPKHGLDVDTSDASFFLGRETLILTDKGGMSRWRKALFAYMSRNARPANGFFQIPANRVVELGTQIEL